MQLLRTNSIKCKKDLYAYYADQMPASSIGKEIQDIMRLRKNYKGKDPKNAQLIYLKEVIVFICNNDPPCGYKLDEEMAERLTEYKRVNGFK